VIVELLPQGDVRLSKAHGEPIRGLVTTRELRIVLRTARDAHDDLLDLWKASHPK
jgi:hypothetical protein